jgi:hypothetical protein
LRELFVIVFYVVVVTNAEPPLAQVRYPIMLTAREKRMAQEVCSAFRQNVVGCDLLRTPDRTYICDVNGWSFVKKRHDCPFTSIAADLKL